MLNSHFELEKKESMWPPVTLARTLKGRRKDTTMPTRSPVGTKNQLTADFTMTRINIAI